MAKKESDTSKEEELEEDAETDEAEEESDEESEDEDESEEEESEDEDESSHNDSDIDYDAEIEKERGKRKPDKEKAKEAFQARKNRRSDEDGDDDESSLDKPMTVRQMREYLASSEKKALENAARQIAKSLATSDKEATLIVERWRNRIFPEDMSLDEQVEEMYVSIHRKKLIGERNEAFRALKNKGRVNNNAAATHRDAQKGNQALKMNEADKRAIIAAGYAWNGSTRLFEKKIGEGKMLVYDPKSKSTRVVQARK